MLSRSAPRSLFLIIMELSIIALTTYLELFVAHKVFQVDFFNQPNVAFILWIKLREKRKKRRMEKSNVNLQITSQ